MAPLASERPAEIAIAETPSAKLFFLLTGGLPDAIGSRPRHTPALILQSNQRSEPPRNPTSRRYAGFVASIVAKTK